MLRSLNWSLGDGVRSGSGFPDVRSLVNLLDHRATEGQRSDGCGVVPVRNVLHRYGTDGTEWGWWDPECSLLPIDGRVDLPEPRESENDAFSAEFRDKEVGPGVVLIDGEALARKVPDPAGLVLGTVDIQESDRV